MVMSFFLQKKNSHFFVCMMFIIAFVKWRLPELLPTKLNTVFGFWFPVKRSYIIKDFEIKFFV